MVGTLLAVGALAFVVSPLFLDETERTVARDPRKPVAHDSAIRALREIEFDRATGKLSEVDYAELRQTYGELALREMRDAAKPEPVSDPIETRVQAYRRAHRECVTCGLRPESDAIYCSTCGSYLDGICPDCGTAVSEPAAAFCASCGSGLARAAMTRPLT